MTESSFYNTNQAEGAELADSKKAAKGQESAIYGFFSRHPMSEYTRKEIELYFSLPTPSATRALANLTRARRLEKSDKTIKCRVSGKSVHTWRLARVKVMEQGSLF